MLSSPTQFLCWGLVVPWGGDEVMEGKSGDDEPHTSLKPNRYQSIPILTHLLQPSHWAQIILVVCFGNPCSFPPLAGVSCPGQHQTLLPLLPCPTKLILPRTIHRFPPDSFIFPLHHRHLSTPFLSLKTVLREPQSFLFIILYQSSVTEQHTLCLPTSQQPATWL